MAAWYLGVSTEDGEDNEEVVAAEFAKMTAKAKIRL